MKLKLVVVIVVGCGLGACAPETEDAFDSRAQGSASVGEQTGRLVAVISDSLDGDAMMWWHLHTDDGRTLRVEGLDHERLEELNGARVVFIGDLQGNILTTSRSQLTVVDPPRVSQSAQSDAGFGEKRVAVLIVDFSSNRLLSPPKSDVQASYFGPFPSVGTFFEHVSYGDRTTGLGTWLTGETLPRNPNAEVYVLPIAPPTSCGGLLASEDDALMAAYDEGVDLSQFDRFSIVVPQVSTCAFAGAAELQPRTFQVRGQSFTLTPSWINGWYRGLPGMYLLAHEQGHNYGLGHAASLRYPGNSPGNYRGSNVDVANYGNPFDVMGNCQSSAICFPSVSYGHFLGWIDDSRSPLVSGFGTSSVTMTPLEVNDGRIKGVRIPRTDTETYHLEYRRAAGGVIINVKVPPNGVAALNTYLLHESNSNLIVLRNAGDRFVDLHAGLTVTATAVSASEATLEIVRVEIPNLVLTPVARLPLRVPIGTVVPIAYHTENTGGEPIDVSFEEALEERPSLSSTWTTLASRRVQGLGPRQVLTDGLFTWAARACGSFHVRVSTDTRNVIWETEDEDNVYPIPYYFPLPFPGYPIDVCPDLGIASFTGPSTLAVGQVGGFAFAAVATLPLGSAVRVGLYVREIGQGGWPTQPADVLQRTVPIFDQLHWAAPHCGDYLVKVRVDDDQQVPEANETNNETQPLVVGVCVPPCGRNGDVDHDGRLSPGDAACASQIVTSGGTLPPSCDVPAFECEVAAADVDCNGTVTTGDVAAIFARFQSARDPALCFADSSPPGHFPRLD